MTHPASSKASPNNSFVAREAALELLSAVIQDRKSLADLTTGRGPIADLAPPQKARAQRLATSTLRNISRADAMIARYVEKLPPPNALNILRLAVVELLVEGEAPHGVVDTAVNLMRRSRQSRRMSGLANAVLRKVATEGPEIWPTLAIPQMPKWLRKRLIHIFDLDIVARIEAAHWSGAPLDLTPRDPTQAAQIAETLEGQVLPSGTVRVTDAGQVSQLEGYSTGQWWVQDAGAALAVKLLAPKPGETILDLCAAPGGKTMQLTAAGAQVTALDVNAYRMKRVQENLERTGLTAELIIEDALTWTPPVLYDAILLDAPCSATGTVRRHPDLPYIKRSKDLHSVFELQSALIDRAVLALKPGGRLLFCTCSLLTEEGERQAKLAMERHALSEILPDPGSLGIPQHWCHPQGGLRLRPDFLSECGGIDGFFMISLRKAL